MGERGYKYTSNAGIRLSAFEALISTKRRVVLAYSRFVAILRRKKDFYQFLMESAKRTTPRKLHRVCTFIFLFIHLHAFANVLLSSIIAVILIIVINILLLWSIIAISLMQCYILIRYCLILFFLSCYFNFYTHII